MQIPSGKKIYFSSDNHLGAPNAEESKLREKKFVRWLNEIESDAAAIFLLGDLFDFWFEYKHVVPKGFVRVFGKLAELSDSGIPIYFFVGNHDLWMQDYFEKELNIPVYHQPKTFSFNKVFTNSFAKWLYRWFHPDIGVPLAKHLSVKNKMISGDEDEQFLGKDNEWLAQYANRKLESEYFDYFVFGHRHLPMEVELNKDSTYYNLGDWISHYTYGVFDGEKFELKEFD